MPLFQIMIGVLVTVGAGFVSTSARPQFSEKLAITGFREDCPMRPTTDEAACCVDQCDEDSTNAGEYCAADSDCPGGLCRNTCEVTTEVACLTAGGFWLGGTEPPVLDCTSYPCVTGACCTSPVWWECEDGSDYDTEDECESAGGKYVGGVTCDNGPCPLCQFACPGNCHDEDPDGYMIPIDRAFSFRAADDFQPTGGLIGHVCWTAGFYAPGVGECADDPPFDGWQAVFYEDLNGLPDVNNVVAGPMDVVVEGKDRRGGGSRYWDYQGSVEPVTVTPGECYWIELSGEGDGVCAGYWKTGLANGHSLSDCGGNWGPEDARPFDFDFCLDSGMADDDCGPVYGVCCTCPVIPPGEGVCQEGVLQADCLENGGTWIVGTGCDPNPCSDTPANDECADAELVPSPATGDVTVQFENRSATDDDPYIETNCGGTGDLHYDVWFAYNVEASGELTISSCGLLEWDQMIAVYDVTDPGKDCANLTRYDEITCGDDDCGIFPGPSEVVFRVTTGQELLVRVGGWDKPPDYLWNTRGDGEIRFLLRLSPPQAPAWPHNAPKNRYISFAPDNGVELAYRVEMTASGYFPNSTGVLGWVGEPDENGIARLVDAPVHSDSWPAVVHVGDRPIVPVATYAIRSTPDGATFSDPLEVPTIARPSPKYWADCVGALEGGGWTAPNGVVNMDDVMAGVQKFTDDPNAPHLTWVDVDGEIPNAVLNFGDIQMIVNGFKGEPYPFTMPIPGMVLITGGEFEMGDHHDGMSNALPVHAVYIDSFQMDVYEVSNEQYCAYLNDAYPSKIKVDGGIVYDVGDTGNAYPYCDTYTADDDSRIHFSAGTFTITAGKEDHPMVEVSWYGAVAYANWRSAQDGRTPSYNLSTWQCNFRANGYRLPTEAEWEYAARGSEYSPYYRYPWGDTLDGAKANYWESGDPYETGDYPWTTPVGYYDGGQTPAGGDMANGYGLYDMAGNVWEWCNDWYDSDYYESSPYTNPPGPPGGTSRVLRGGSWGNLDYVLRCAGRDGYGPGWRFYNRGFRLLLD